MQAGCLRRLFDMSNPVSFSTNSNAFLGGSYTPASGPGAVNGAITGASTGGSLIGGVTGGTPMLARNSRGTNITVPYARVVFHPPGNTALPPKNGERSKDKQLELDLASRMLKTPASAIMTETEMLYSGRLCFVLGRRGNTYSPGVEAATGLDYINQRPLQLTISSGTGGIATAQRLCSFEYLERYFQHVLSSRLIVVGGGGADAMLDLTQLAPNLKGAVMKRLRDDNKAGGGLAAVTALRNPTGFNVAEILNASADVDAGVFAEIATQGIDANNDSPFLHGKSRSRQLHIGSRYKRTNLAIGDEVAFKWLYQSLLKNGILDWSPDGVVLSKLSEGDRLLDDELDSRDGMLFNVAISGPAISSLWSQDASLEVMPLDRVFIAIIADRWVGKVNAETLTDAKKQEELANPVVQKVGDTFTLTNFRVKRMTSAQMVAACKDTDKGLSKLDLKRGGKCSEYVIGAWCIGSIIDSAASRAASNDSSTLVGAIKRTRVNSAHNLVVKVEWWDSDKLCRSYGPRGRRARYDGPSTRLQVNGRYRENDLPSVSRLDEAIDNNARYSLDASLQRRL